MFLLSYPELFKELFHKNSQTPLSGRERNLFLIEKLFFPCPYFCFVFMIVIEKLFFPCPYFCFVFMIVDSIGVSLYILKLIFQYSVFFKQAPLCTGKL